MTARRTCILVLGMHRSGTSALARIIGLLGAALPQNLLGAAHGNETGHWEPARLVALHDQMLKESGSRWDDWRAFDPALLGAERLAHFRQEIGRIIAEDYGDTPLFVLKDPRIARFVPLYADILGSMAVEMRCAHITRNPLSVAASLSQRDGSTAGFAALLWLRHALDAERATRSAPRVFVSYEDLAAGWRPVIDRIAVTLGLAWPRSIEEAAASIEADFSADLQHHRADAEQLSRDERIPVWVKDAYGALKALEADPTGAGAMAALDAVAAEFNAAAPIFGAAFFAELDARQQIFGEAIAGMRCLAEQRAGEIARLAAELTAAGRHSAELEQQAASAEQELAALRRAIASIHRSSSWRITAPLRSIGALRAKLSGAPKE